MQVAATIDYVRIGITFLHSMELVYLAPPVGLNLLMSSYRFHKAVALLRATLPVISVLSVAVLPTISIPGAHYGPTALVESLRKRSNEPHATHIPVAATNKAG